MAVPKPTGVSVAPLIEATAGLEDVNVQAPGPVDVGAIRVTLPTLSFMSVIFPKVPRTGTSATTVRVIFAVAPVNKVVLDCVAVISTTPPSRNVTTFPLTDAIEGLDDAYVQLPLEVDVGGLSINEPCVIETDCDANTPTIGVPGLTTNSADRERSVNAPLAACVAVIVDVPVERIIRTPPLTVATRGLEETYDHDPGEFVVGGTIVTVPTPYVVVMRGNGPKIVAVA